MSELVLSLKALEDLTSILEYIARDRPAAAVRFVDALESRCQLLAKHPDLGTRRDDLAVDLRVFVYRSYAIYYRRLENIVRIDRVLHGAIDETSINFSAE